MSNAYTVLGFDFGTTKIGIATGQTLTKTATPYKIIKATDGLPNWEELEKIITQWKPKHLVVGIPYEIDGGIGLMANRAQKFANRLKEKFQLPVYTIDETGTTKLANSAIDQNKAFFEKRHTNKNDSIAAAIILSEWLNTN